MRNKELLQPKVSNIDTLLSAGLDPKDYVMIYKELGLSAISCPEKVDELSLSQWIFDCLQNYGPFIMIRLALGADMLHAETILGIISGNEQKVDKIVVFRGDTMQGKINYYSIGDFRELIQFSATDTSHSFKLPLFWYAIENHHNTHTIAKKTQSECDKLYQETFSTLTYGTQFFPESAPLLVKKTDEKVKKCCKYGNCCSIV